MKTPFIDMYSETADEEYEAFKKEKARSTRTGEVCVCGHSLTYHSRIGGANVCAPGRTECDCQTPRSVLTSSNLRPFMQKTEGASGLHALGKGIRTAIKGGAKVEWSVPMVCDRCKREVDVLAPVALNPAGLAVDHTTIWNALVCKDCMEAL